MVEETIIIASDHAGYELKEGIKRFLAQAGYQYVDAGTEDSRPVDYPEYAEKVASAVSDGRYRRGILVCGTGLGMAIVANKFPGVRATPCNDIFTARISREHNDSNVLVLGGRILGNELAKEVVKTWLETPFSGGRHERRISLIKGLEERLSHRMVGREE